MSLILKKVNYSKTRTRLKKYMEEYALLSLKLEEEQLPKASGKYLLSFNGPSVLSSRNSHVENQVIDKIILEEKIVYYLEKIVQSFNKLNEEERKYIYLKYFIDKKLSDEEIQKNAI